MKSIIILALLFVFSVNAIESTGVIEKDIDTISLKGNWFIGYKYSYKLSPFDKPSRFFGFFYKEEFIQIIEPNEIAFTELRKSQSLKITILVLSSMTGIFIGWNLGNAMWGKPINKPTMIAAIPLFSFALSLDILSTKKFKKSVSIFNKMKQ